MYTQVPSFMLLLLNDFVFCVSIDNDFVMDAQCYVLLVEALRPIIDTCIIDRGGGGSFTL